MNGWSKTDVLNIIKTDLTNIHNRKQEIKKELESACDEIDEYLNSLLEQVPLAIAGPLIPKTPKVPRKKDIKRIETIPEDEVAHNASKTSNTVVEESKMEEEEDLLPTRTSRRAASQKATMNIKKQQSLSIMSKMRRPSSDNEEEVPPMIKPMRPSRVKRTKSVATSSDEEETKRPSKFSKTKQKIEDVSVMKVIPKIEPNDTFVTSVSSRPEEEPSTLESTKRVSRNRRTREETNSTSSASSNTRASKKSQELAAKKNNVVDETMDMPDHMDVTVEPSLYEDAVGKSIPMNSTMNPNTTVTIDRKMMNVTVVLEPIRKSAKADETITIQKAGSGQSSSRNTLVNEETTLKNIVQESPLVSNSVLQSKSTLKDRMKALKEMRQNKEFDALITEDESSPERHEEISTKKPTKDKKPDKKTKKRFTRSSLISDDDDDDDEVTATPAKNVLRDVNVQKAMKNTYKPNQLFSPYAKDSVKKRVEAFEQAGLNSPKSVDVDTPPRVTRTKTRAMAAAEAGSNHRQSGQTEAQKAARKSLAKAKKISLLKQMRDNDDGKENNVISSAQKPSRLMAMNDKLAQKQQQRTTPVGKSRLQMPMSVNRIYHTPSNQVAYQNKATTATKSTIVSGIESFLAPPKTLTKSNSNDNLTEKKRKINDEDARRKREDALKAVSEEKRRKREEKELKNKLAREAKEKLDMEKRLKLEREREEKAKTALMLQEKQREESERKRLLQLQRAQEKEERRRQEEHLRQLRLQEQEEAERQLAEQKRREQEAERRKQAEARAQQLAAAEANRMKAHYLAKAKLAAKNQPGPTSYKLDSEPDDEDASDDESRPKHVIPYWAQASVRKTQLALQEYIPLGAALQFFGAKRCTPDLTELFTGIKKDRLLRTSSAIWKPPPRYSMMVDE